MDKPRLYREHFTAEECAELDRTETFSAVSELSLLRILIARLLRTMKRIKTTVAHHFKTLVAFSYVGMTIASLARYQRNLDGPPLDPALEALMALDPADL